MVSSCNSNSPFSGSKEEVLSFPSEEKCPKKISNNYALCNEIVNDIVKEILAKTPLSSNKEKVILKEKLEEKEKVIVTEKVKEKERDRFEFPKSLGNTILTITKSEENNKSDDCFILLDHDKTLTDKINEEEWEILGRKHLCGDNENKSNLASKAYNLYSKACKYSCKWFSRLRSSSEPVIIFPNKAVEKEPLEENKEKAYLQSLKNRYITDTSIDRKNSWEEIDYEATLKWGDKNLPDIFSVTDGVIKDLPRSVVDLNGKRLLKSTLPEKFQTEGFSEAKELNISFDDQLRFIQLLSQSGLALLTKEICDDFVWIDKLYVMNEDHSVVSECYRKLEEFILVLNNKDPNDTKEVKVFLEEMVSVLFPKKETSMKKEICKEKKDFYLTKLEEFISLGINDKIRVISLINSRLQQLGSVKEIISPFCEQNEYIIKDDLLPFGNYTNANMSSQSEKNEIKKKVDVYKCFNFNIHLHDQEDKSLFKHVAKGQAELFVDFEKKKAYKRVRILSIDPNIVK